MKATISIDGETRTVLTEMVQWCPVCREMIHATLYLEYKNHRHCADKSTCPKCGKVLWDWRWTDGKPLDEAAKQPTQLKLW